jgi:hypothetical protein
VTVEAEDRPARSGGEALRLGAAFGFAASATVIFAAALAGGAMPGAQLAAVIVTVGLPAAAWGAVYGHLRGARARLVVLWSAPPLVLLGGALFVRILLWPQADHGGLATAAVALLTIAAATTAAAIAAYCTLARGTTERRRADVLAIAGAVMVVGAALRVWAG